MPTAMTQAVSGTSMPAPPQPRSRRPLPSAERSPSERPELELLEDIARSRRPGVRKTAAFGRAHDRSISIEHDHSGNALGDRTVIFLIDVQISVPVTNINPDDVEVVAKIGADGAVLHQFVQHLAVE